LAGDFELRAETCFRMIRGMGSSDLTIVLSVGQRVLSNTGFIFRRGQRFRIDHVRILLFILILVIMIVNDRQRGGQNIIRIGLCLRDHLFGGRWLRDDQGIERGMRGSMEIRLNNHGVGERIERKRPLFLYQPKELALKTNFRGLKVVQAIHYRLPTS
jgi:hypothetical protein